MKGLTVLSLTEKAGYIETDSECIPRRLAAGFFLNFLLVSWGNAILRRLLMEPGDCHVSIEDKGGFHED